LILLQTIPEPCLGVRYAVVAMRPRIDVDDAVLDDGGIGLDVVGPGIERAAALQIEASMMPMAGQDAVGDASLVQREAHVWAAVVDGVDRLGDRRGENGDPVPSPGDDRHSAQLRPRADADEVSIRLHDRAVGPGADAGLDR
jgi:hypothetical protein